MSILIKIRECNTFSENESIVAEYILKNYKGIKGMTQKEISTATYTSFPTVTRMCKKIGFNGFRDFKLEIMEEIAYLDREVVEFKVEDIEKDSETSVIIEKLNKISIDSLNENRALQSVELIERIASLIEKYDVIDFYGSGASYLVCLDAQYKFLRLGKVANAFSSYDKQYITARTSNEKHLAIIVSYSGKTKEMIEIAKILERKNIDRISITRCVDNELTKYCNYNLFVTSKESLKRSAAVYSRIAMLNLIDVIYFVFFNRNYEECKKNIYETKINK